MDKMIGFLMFIGILLIIIGVSSLIYSIAKLFKKKKDLKSLPSVFVFFIIMSAIGASFFYMGLFFHTFARYTAEDNIGWVYAEADSTLISIIYYDANSDSTHKFKILGDQWMIEGKFLRWNLMLRFLGKGAYYKVSRFSGRWDIGGGKPSFYEIEGNPGVWKYLLKYSKEIPFVDTAYGIGAFQYATGDTFDIFINDTGFIIRKR